MFELYVYLLTFFVAIIASVVGTISGGGALIAFPFLLFIGLEPKVAIAIMIVSTLGIAVGAIPNFVRKKKIIWDKIIPFTLLGILGAFIGSNLLINLNEEFFSKIIAFILILLLCIFFINKDFGIKEIKKSKKNNLFGYVIYFLLAIYSSFFGVASGTFIIYCLVYFFGMTFIQANATDLFVLFFVSFTAFLVFAYNGILEYSILAIFLFGTVIGGHIGSSIAIKKGEKWVKIVIFVVMIITILKLLLYN